MGGVIGTKETVKDRSRTTGWARKKKKRGGEEKERKEAWRVSREP